MHITRFHTNDAAQTAFETRALPLSEQREDEFGHEILSSLPFAAEAVLVELPLGLDQDWHGAPDRQLVVVLEGRLEVEVGDGSCRQWGPGGLFLADDLHGQGHRTRVLDGPVRLVFLRLDAGFDLAAWPRA